MSKKLTDWFRGDVRPVRSGYYQRDYGSSNNDAVTNDYWDGRVWRFQKNGSCCFNQFRRWRGLAADPKAKP